MNLRTPIAMLAAGALALTPIVLAPAAQAATTTYAVNCTSTNTAPFTIASGDVIIFDVSQADCVTGLGLAITAVKASPGNNALSDDEAFAVLVAQIANLTGTGGTALANWTARTVTYTAGPNSGTDSIVISNTGAISSRGLRPRAGSGTTTLSMTVPGSDGPPPQLEMYGRKASETCPTGWGNSWAQWPNNNTGGFVCVREHYYNNSTRAWAYR